MSDSTFRHKHLFTFRVFFDANGDGILSWDDFLLLAEKFTKLQRKGKVEPEVLARWTSIFDKWWSALSTAADYNKDTLVEFDEWLQFFEKLRQTTKSYEELPDFLKAYLQLFFLSVDTNKDALFCLKDYKKYLTSHGLDTSRAEECFRSMLNEEDVLNENAMTSDRFKQLVYQFWTSKEPGCPGNYICGPFDSMQVQQLETGVAKKKSS